MASTPSAPPRAPGFDNTLALFREGYDFIGKRCRQLGADGFETRLMLRPVLCLQGEEAARLVYGSGLFTRKGAMPPTTLRLLQDKGSVQSLDGPAHRHRKALFVRMLMQTPPDRMVQLFEQHWRKALASWEQAGKTELFGAANLVLTRAAWEWTGLPPAELNAKSMCDRLVGMVENAGRVDPRMWGELARRSATERQVEDLVKRIRSGELALPTSAPARLIAEHRDETGKILASRVAAVELINLLRPIVAVGRWILFSGMALHQHPQWRTRLAAGADDWLEPFAEEVRRLYPFFPVIGGVATAPFTWGGKRYEAGQWVMLDLFGTNHDPRLSPEPTRFEPERAPSWRAQDFRFMPQGAGDTRTDHRCPGEQMTVALMVSAIRMLTREMSFAIPEQDLDLPFNRLPTRPSGGLRLTQVRAVSRRNAAADGASATAQPARRA
jgi:fatty-acid peroxygenase